MNLKNIQKSLYSSSNETKNFGIPLTKVKHSENEFQTRISLPPKRIVKDIHNHGTKDAFVWIKSSDSGGLT